MTTRKAFDGIICIGGEDWWYHNRGHFDFQIMRRLARKWPVLFVNSLGVRMPSLRETSQFAERIGRKLKSLARGVVEVEPGLWVFSPVSFPGPVGQKLSGSALAPQIRLAAAHAGIRRPLLWMHCPAGARLIGSLNEVATVMQRTDRFEAFPEADPAIVGPQVALIRAAAELVVYAAPHLMAEEATRVRRQILVTHGVEFERFSAVGDARGFEPDDLAALPHPRAGFIGGIDAHTFDPGLFVDAARALPHVQFVLIGGCSLPEGWLAGFGNVTLLGRKPYDVVARYMAGMSVLLMPWNKSDWIKACNPIKLKEYLAVGRPVVTTDFPALAPWRDLVRVGDDAAAFSAAISAAIEQPYDARPARMRVATEGWDAKAELVGRAILDLGLEFASRRAASPVHGATLAGAGAVDG